MEIKCFIMRQINIKNCSHYFFSEMINIKDFDSSLLDIDKYNLKVLMMYLSH